MTHSETGRPIRVLHVITRMVRGGAQENTLATTIGIHGGGWDSQLAAGLARGPEGSLEPECCAAAVRLLRVPGLVRELSPRRDVVALWQLAALFRRERPHLVHTHTSKAGILGRIAARWARVPVVIHTPHGHVFHSYGGRLRSALFIAMERICAPLADRLVALTDAERQEHLDVGIGRAGQWATIHSGVEFSLFDSCRLWRRTVRAELGIPEDAVVMGTVGRLVPVKGQAYLLEALARLARREPRLHLLLVGEGPLRPDLIVQAGALGLAVREHGITGVTQPVPHAPVVHFLGLRRDVPRCLAAMDLFALPSLNEGMGRVLVEAMAMELPCVASRISGITDVVDDQVTGLLVSPCDPEALATALNSLLNDPRRARAMGCQGRLKAVPEFSRERMIEKLELLYRELLTEKGIPAPSAAARR
jgi:glycosyltransferase involved in cell wall biosynthesis